jgi:hypothetical protein
MSSERGGKRQQLAQRSLLIHRNNGRPSLSQVRSNSKQQRARTRDHHPLPRDPKASLDESLKPTSAKDTRKRPSRKWQESLPSTGSQNELAPLELMHLRRTVSFDDGFEPVISRRIDDSMTGEPLNS